MPENSSVMVIHHSDYRLNSHAIGTVAATYIPAIGMVMVCVGNGSLCMVPDQAAELIGMLTAALDSHTTSTQAVA
ncbi:hypothetical protein ACLMAL_39515 [Nocardia sp. CWNU-33]|uniref:hypothetical protein n=1 Tax=Nocardia sp. CWNU-33 TaxID=3392117 RepID=UPI00398E8B37